MPLDEYIDATGVTRVVTPSTPLPVGLGVGFAPAAPSASVVATAPMAGSVLDNGTARASHTLQVDIATTTAGTTGTHSVQLQGSLDDQNWYAVGAAVTPASTSTNAADASNHAAVSATGQPWRYLRANWTAKPTSWVGTLTATIASA